MRLRATLEDSVEPKAFLAWCYEASPGVVALLTKAEIERRGLPVPPEKRGSVAIVVDVATRDDVETEAALRRSGYSRRELWMKHLGEDSAAESRVLMALGVARFLVSWMWGRGQGITRANLRANHERTEAMTIAVRISNEDGERRRSVRVRTFTYAKGESGRHEGYTQDIQPGQSAVFYIHALADLSVEEGAILHAEPGAAHYPPGMRAESQRLHREYNTLVEAQRNGAKNGPEVVKLTDECAAKGITLVPGGENL